MTLLRNTFLLTAVYIALTSNVQPSNFAAGFVLGAAITLLMRASIPMANERADWHSDWRLNPGSISALFRYILILIKDLIISGIQVARLVLDPNLPVHQGNVAIPTTCRSEASQALSAHAITVTPGELVVEIGADGTMFTHVLDVALAEENSIKAQQIREEMLEKIAA